MCLYPKLILNKKYVGNEKNNYNPPELKDERLKYVPVGCNRCMECRKQKANEWRVRLNEEMRNNSDQAYFVNFTFSNEALRELDSLVDNKYYGWIRDNEICRIAIRRYLERWRKKHKRSVRHWFISEQGGQYGRIHLHGIMWTEHPESIKERWGYGYVHIGDYVNGKSVNYMVKYVMKSPEYNKDFRGKIFASKGIGKGYLDRIDSKKNIYKKRGITNETYRTPEGLKLSLPIYYRNGIYSEEEREKLWLEKLDKEERYVMGERVSVKDDDEEYNRLRAFYREKNIRLGYGCDDIGKDEKIYKMRVRELKELKYKREAIDMMIKNNIIVKENDYEV